MVLGELLLDWARWARWATCVVVSECEMGDLRGDERVVVLCFTRPGELADKARARPVTPLWASWVSSPYIERTRPIKHGHGEGSELALYRVGSP